MSKVFTLTVIPATRHAKEWLIVSVAPGVPNEMVARNMTTLEQVAKLRNANLTFAKDLDVQVAAQSWWQRWRSRRTVERIRKENGR